MQRLCGLMRKAVQAYGVIKPRKVNLTVDGAEVEAVRCDIQAYYAVLATITSVSYTHLDVYKRQQEDSGQTAVDKTEEGGDDVKSSCPL